MSTLGTTTYNSIEKTVAYLHDKAPHPFISQFVLYHPTTREKILSDWETHVKDLAASKTSGKIVAALDTGFSFPPLPAAAVDAIYGSIPGAKFDRNGAVWIVPCTAATNLSFVFG